MAESLVLVAETRAGRGKQAARRLRRTGKVPAVLYGHKEETLSVALPLEELTRESPEEIERIVDEKLDLVGMKDAKHLMPSELSGGMRKRISLARAARRSTRRSPARSRGCAASWRRSSGL